MMKVSTSSAKNGNGRSISEAVWLSLLGFAATGTAQANTADAALSAEGAAAAAALQDLDQGALSEQGEQLVGEADLAAQDVVAQELFADADGQHLSAIIDQYVEGDTSSQAFSSTEESAQEVADLVPQAGAFDKLAQGQSYKLAQAGNGSVAAPAMSAPAFDPSMLALLGLGGVALVAAASSSGGSSAPATASIGGKAIDGYLAGATAFYDADGDGKLGDGEVSTTTDASGNFELVGVTPTEGGRLVIEGGTDILTGKAFTGQLVSNSNAATGVVVSPLTTLLASGSISAAELTAALGLPEGVDLASFDPIAALNSGDANGEAVLLAAQQVFTVIATLVAQGASAADAAGNLAGALKAGGANLESAVNSLVDEDTATALNNINSAIEASLGGGNLVAAFSGDNAASLTQIMKSVVVAQTSFIGDVEQGHTLTGKYSGDSLNTLIEQANVELSTDLVNFLDEHGFDMAGAEFDPTISQDVLDALGELYPDLDPEVDLGLEVVACQ